jgi:anti-sigma factor RsiW
VSDGAFARDYALAALPELVSTELTSSQVSAFYDRQFGELMQPAALLDAPVRRVAVCDVEGRRGAMVEYDFDGERLVYYQLPLEESGGAAKLRTAREGSLNMARWGDGTSEHVIVSEMPAEHLKDIARTRMN